MFLRVLFFSAAFAVASAAPSAADTLRAGGVGASAAMLPALFATFDAKGEHKLEFIPSLGTSGGLQAAADGMLDLAMSGRPLKPEEAAQGLSVALSARTPFLFVTSRSGPEAAKSVEIVATYLADRSTWPDGSPVRIILRPISDSDTPTLKAMLPGMAAALDAAHKRKETPLAATDQDNADMAERISGSLATSTLTQVQMERRRLRALSIDGKEPTLENLANGSYPFSKPILFVLPARKTPLAERFVAFLTTPEGRAALAATGNLTEGARP